MIVVFALGIHLLLLSVYAFMIQSNRSRLNMGHLLLALFLPFVGELCLVAAEVGKVPKKSKYYTNSDHRIVTAQKENNYSIPADWKKIILGEEADARFLLIDVINNASDTKITEVLKTALHSKSTEVSHIAAAGLMRLNKKHEDAITIARDDCIARENNMLKLASYIDVIHAYYTSGLPDECSLEELRETELKLLDRYLESMPQDDYYLMLKNTLKNSEAKTDE